MVSAARKKYLESLTPAQQAENIATAEGYTSAAQKAAGGSPPSVKTITVSPEQEHAWGLGGATYAQQQAAAEYMSTPQGQANAGAIYGQQDYLQQQQQMMQQPQTPVSIGTSGMVTPYQDPGLWEKTKAATQDIYGYLRHPETLGAQMQQLPIENAPPPLGYQALGLGAALLEPGIGGAEIKAGEKLAGATARRLGLSWRDLLLNPRLIDEYIKTGALTVEKAKVLREGIRELVKTTIKITQPGELLMKEGGEEILASTVKPALATATKEAVNAVTEKLKGSLIKKWALSNGVKVLGIGTLYKYNSNSESAQKELTKYLEESMELRRQMIDSGDPEMIAMADELAREAEQLEADLDKWYINFPFGGANDKIQEAKRRVNEANNEFKKYKAAAEKKAVQDQLDKEAAQVEADGKVLSKIPLMSDEEIVADTEIITAANTNPFIKQLYMDAQQRILDTIKRKEQRLYEEAKSEADKRYIESQKQEQRTYTEAVAEEAEGGGLNWWGSW